MRSRIALVLLVVGCGPVVGTAADTDPDPGDETGSSTDPIPTPSTTTAVETTSGVPDPDPSTTGVVPSDTSSEGESVDDDTFDDGCGFLCEPDDGDSFLECDVWAQDCPKGEKCMPWANDGGSSWNATRCSPLDGSPGQAGDPCMVEGSGVSGIDDCDIGVMCFGVDEKTNEGTCVAMCSGNEANPTCDDGTACALSGDGVLALCLGVCDPLVQDCAEGEGCYPANDTFMCIPVIVEGAFGEPCEQIAGCSRGLFCAEVDAVPGCAGEVGCCSSYCDFSDPNAAQTCPGVAGGQECVQWFEDGQAPMGFETLGACAVPQ